MNKEIEMCRKPFVLLIESRRLFAFYNIWLPARVKRKRGIIYEENEKSRK